MQSLLRRLLIGIVLALACASVSAFPGQPLLQRFTPADFKATPYLFGVARDAQGRVYVGNADGVLRLQGREWETIHLPGGMAAGSLASGSDGTVYLAGYDSFGYIDTADDGSAVYHDLRDAFDLHGSARALGWMAQVVPVAGGVYFRAQREMFFYGFDGRRQHWPMPDEDSGFSAWRGDLYTLDTKAGLLRFADGKLVPVPGGQVMRGHRGIDIVALGEQAVVASVGGFYRLDGQGVSKLDVPPMPADAGIFSTTMPLRDGGFVVATVRGELLEYDAGAHLRARYQIARSSIGALAADVEDGLWASSEDELVRLQLPSAWSRVDVGDLGGVVADVEQYRGALWLAVGIRGLARLTDAGGQVRTDWIADEDRNQIFALAGTTDGLLVARSGGIDVIGTDDRATHLLGGDEPVYALVRSRYDHDLVYAPGDAGVHVLRRHGQRWTYAGLLPAPELATQSVLEVAPGVLWINNTRGLPERWHVDPVAVRLLARERFALKDGKTTRDPNLSAQIFALDNEVFLDIGAHAYRFDGHVFAPFAGAPFSLLQNPNAFSLLQTAAGTFAFTGNRLYRREEDGHWRRLDFGAQPIASQALLRFGRDGVLRLSVWRALLQYRSDAAASPPLPPLPVRMTSVQVTAASGAIVHLPVEAGIPPALAQDRTLGLHYGVFSPEPGVEYRYRINGLSNVWSDWREQTVISVGGIDQPGDYVVEIDGRSPSGRSILPIRYAFSIQPRWYQITTVRLVGALVFLLALWGFIRWREGRQARVFAHRQRQLEEKIAERTAELETANRKLAELATADALTGVANRRALEAALPDLWRRCQQTQAPIAALMIDVDHFKQYNDQYGHLAGDAVLKAVAARLTEGIEANDELLARYGGEEFCLLLPGVNLAAASARAQRLRLLFDTERSPVTVSVGVAVRVPAVGDAAEVLLRAADDCLYVAKRHGRNRVEIDPGSVDAGPA